MMNLKEINPENMSILERCGTLFLAVAGSASVGALGGYVYAKMANLPATRAAKLYAIFLAAQTAIITFSALFINNGLAKGIVNAGVMTGSFIGLSALRSQGVMGRKMFYFTLIGQAFMLLNYNKTCE